MSQHELSLILGSNPTMVERVERFENISGWDKIYAISQQLDVNFCDLFILKKKDELLSIVEESLKLENKLTKDKKNYYIFLKKTINNEFNSLNIKE